MQRIRVFYFFQMGAVLNQLYSIMPGQKVSEVYSRLAAAVNEIHGLSSQSLMRIRATQPFTDILLKSIERLFINQASDSVVDAADLYNMHWHLTQFITALNAETSIADTFVITSKRGLDTTALIDDGSVLFQPEVALKVPEAVADLRAAGKCIAFELPTAAGFHLHRANESVLHAYYDAVTNKRARPKNRNIGEYIKILEELSNKDKVVLSALRDLKDLHRNPLVHPDESLDTIDEALALVGSIQAVVVAMLKAIPLPGGALASVFAGDRQIDASESEQSS